MSNQKKMLPYHFVPNHQPGDILEPLVSHVPGEDENLYSGEMQVELTCLTPFFTGAERYKKTRDGYRPKGKGDEKEHTYIAPLTYPSMRFDQESGEPVIPEGAQFVIPPTTLKGLYGNLIDKITAAPMKRVTEPKSGIQFRLLKSPQMVRAGILFEGEDGWKIYPAKKNPAMSFHRHWRTRARVHSVFDLTTDEVEVAYGYGTKHKSVVISIKPGRTDLLTIPSKVIEIYKQTWDRKTIKNRPELQNGMAIFFLTNEAGKVVAISPNFRLKWPFVDGITQTDRYHSKKPAKNRPQFGYLPGEALKNVAIQETKLTPRQRLLGYTFQQECKQADVAKEKYLEAYAGRVNFNFAVHDHSTGRVYSEPWTLPILGQPKPSSYEHYLQADGHPPLVKDYGLPLHEETQKPKLAGRKHYLHQPVNKVKRSEIHHDNPGQNGTLLSHLRWDFQNDCPFPVFRFTVRFTRLADWEVGLLVRVLNLSGSQAPEKLAALIRQSHKHADALKALELRAIKIGYARPLGWGSAMSQVKGLRLAKSSRNFEKAETSPFLEALDAKMDQWFEEGKEKSFWEKTYATRALDMLSRFRWPEFTQSIEDVDYPRGRKGDIFAYHMDLQKDHVDRRLNKKPGVPSPMPPAEDVWDKSYENRYQDRGKGHQQGTQRGKGRWH